MKAYQVQLSQASIDHIARALNSEISRRRQHFIDHYDEIRNEGEDTVKLWQDAIKTAELEARRFARRAKNAGAQEV